MSNKRKHAGSTTDLSSLSCYKCDKVCLSKRQLAGHLQWCESKNVDTAPLQNTWMPCFKCDREFLTANTLNAHMRWCKGSSKQSSNRTSTYSHTVMNAAVNSGEMGITNNAYLGENYKTQLQYQQSLPQMNNQPVYDQYDDYFQDVEFETEQDEPPDPNVPPNFSRNMELYNVMKNKTPPKESIPHKYIFQNEISRISDKIRSSSTRWSERRFGSYGDVK